MARLKKEDTINIDTLIEQLEENIYTYGTTEILDELADIYEYSRDKQAYMNMLRGAWITIQQLPK
jgi:hypothetical protein